MVFNDDSLPSKAMQDFYALIHNPATEAGQLAYQYAKKAEMPFSLMIQYVSMIAYQCGVVDAMNAVDAPVSLIPDKERDEFFAQLRKLAIPVRLEIEATIRKKQSATSKGQGNSGRHGNDRS